MDITEIKTTCGRAVLIDERDLPLVSPFRWTVKPGSPRTGNWYVKAWINGRNVYMHRLIMSAGPGDEIDHRDGRGFNNTRANLRFCTRSQNCANARRTNSLGYRGVSFHNNPHQKKKFRGKVAKKKDGKTHQHRGPWRENAIEAARDYDRLAMLHFGEFAVLNFPAERAMEAIE